MLLVLLSALSINIITNISVSIFQHKYKGSIERKKKSKEQ